MNLCIDCQHLTYKYLHLEENELYMDDYVCSCPMQGVNPVNGAPFHLPPLRVRMDENMCGMDGRWFVLKPERKDTDEHQ